MERSGIRRRGNLTNENISKGCFPRIPLPLRVGYVLLTGRVDGEFVETRGCVHPAFDQQASAVVAGALFGAVVVRLVGGPPGARICFQH